MIIITNNIQSTLAFSYSRGPVSHCRMYLAGKRDLAEADNYGICQIMGCEKCGRNQVKGKD